MGRHRSTTNTLTRRERSMWAAAVVFVGILSGGVTAVAAPGDTVGCAPGQELVVKAAGTWECRTAPAPSGSPSTSPSASPSPSNPPSPSPSPSTTPAPTTPPPTTPPPSPSPTGPPTLLKNCFTQLAACGYPTTTSTGVPAGTALTVFNGDYYARTAGAVIQNMDLNGCLYVVASNVTIRNTRVRMADRCFYGISTYDVTANGITTVDRVEVVCNYAHGNALAGPGFRVSRAYLHGCENGMEINSNSQIVDSWIAGSEVGSSTAHGDDIQSQGGNNVVIRHNTFAGVKDLTSSIITNPTQNSHWLIEDNFLSSGAYTLYCPEDPAQGDFVVRNNRFYPAKVPNDLRSAEYGLTDACNDSRISWSGNYRDNDLSAVSSTA